jgi:hypothetical protein
MKKLPLRGLAHARSGDKGSSSNVAVFANDEAAYEFLRWHLTAAAVEAYFRPLGLTGAVTRHEAPNLLAFNFLLPGILAGGGSRSLRTDAQGKALGQCLLEMTLEILPMV